MKVKAPPKDTHQSSFTTAEIGQVIDYGVRVLRKNRNRQFIYVVLTNGVAVQLFKVTQDLLWALAPQEHPVICSIFEELGVWLALVVLLRTLLTSEQKSKVLPALLSMKPDDLGLNLPDMGIKGVGLEEVLGAGASGCVYGARYQDSQCVVKVYNDKSDFEQERRMLDRIARSLPATGPLLVPHVVAATECHLLLQPAGIPIRQHLVIARNHVRALIHCLRKLHELRILHRDVRPENLVVFTNGKFKIPQTTDANIGQAVDGAGPQPADHTSGRLLPGIAASPKRKQLLHAAEKKAAVTESATEISLRPSMHAGIYLVDFAYAVHVPGDGPLEVNDRFKGGVKYSSDTVLAQLHSGRTDIRYTEMDEWHSLIRTMYSLAHPLLHSRYLPGIDRSDYAGIQLFWRSVLKDYWDCSELRTPAEMVERAEFLTKTCFVPFEST